MLSLYKTNHLFPGSNLKSIVDISCRLIPYANEIIGDRQCGF
jgi:hypothetical protein